MRITIMFAAAFLTISLPLAAQETLPVAIPDSAIPAAPSPIFQSVTPQTESAVSCCEPGCSCCNNRNFDFRGWVDAGAN